MINAITQLLGPYTPQAGEGLASLNFPWIAGAVLTVLFIWFLMQIVLILIRGGGRRG